MSRFLPPYSAILIVQVAPVLAGSLVDMVEIGRKAPAEFALMVATVLAVVVLPVQTGVSLAIALSLLRGLWATTQTHLVELERFPGETVWWPQSPAMKGERLEGVLVAAFQAPLSFLNVYRFRHDLLAAAKQKDQKLRLIVLKASSVLAIDFTAARVLADTISQCHAQKVDFAIARLESVRGLEALEKLGRIKALGKGRLFHSVDEATRALAASASIDTRRPG